MNISRIVAIYYMAYPDCSPADPACAYSEVYVEVGGPQSRMSNFDKTYSVTVATPSGLAKELSKVAEGYLAQRALVVVPCFKDDVIRKALERLLPGLSDFAVEKT